MSDQSKPRNPPITAAPLGEAPPPDANEVFGDTRNFPFLWRRTPQPGPTRKIPDHFPGQSKPPPMPEG